MVGNGTAEKILNALYDEQGFVEKPYAGWLPDDRYQERVYANPKQWHRLKVAYKEQDRYGSTLTALERM
jgi:hypothetical protein